MRESPCTYPLAKSHSNLISYDMYKDIEEKLAEHRGYPYKDEFVCGLPIGLELPNGVTIGRD